MKRQGREDSLNRDRTSCVHVRGNPEGHRGSSSDLDAFFNARGAPPPLAAARSLEDSLLAAAAGAFSTLAGPPRRRFGPRPPTSNRQPPASSYNRPVGVEDHRKTAVTGVRCAVLTISDTRALETDVSGRTIVELLEGAHHVVAKRQILRVEPKDVHQAVLSQIGGV